MIKKCRHFSHKRCFHESCSWLDGRGNVCVCGLLPNPRGFFHLKVVENVRSRDASGR